jgi:hypothetical protein
MENTDLYQNILDDLRTVAQGGITQAQAFANLREYVPALFPVEPTGDEIRAVTDSDDWKKFDVQARRIFAEAYFSAPREIESKMWDVATFGIQLWEADKKAAKDFTADQVKVRKAAQDYVRVAFRQNVTKLIPAAIDAPEKEEKLPDPTGVLALVTGAMQTLSEKNPDGALALLNGLDSLVKYARPYVAERKPIPAK